MNLLLQKIVQPILDVLDKIIHKYPANNLKIVSDNINTIIVFCYSSHGDIALQSSFIQYLHKKFPKADIEFITSLKCSYTATLLPFVKKIYTVKLKNFWTYNDVENIQKKYKYDLFINTSFYPNLRYLIPFIPLIKVPFFLFKDIPDKIPTPKLNIKINNNKNKYKYIVINLEAGTFRWHKSMPSFEETEKIKREIVRSNPNINFVINQSYCQKNTVYNKNISIFNGNYKKLINIMANSLGVISFRNGLCDVIAAGTKIPQLIIYPKGKYPNDSGIDTIKWAGMKNLGYKSKITEYLVDKSDSKSLIKLIQTTNNFIKKII